MAGLLQTEIYNKIGYGVIGGMTQDTYYQDMMTENGKFKNGADLTKIKPGVFLTFSSPGFIEVGGISTEYAGFLDFNKDYRDAYGNPTTFENMYIQFPRSGGYVIALADADVTKGQRIVMSQTTGEVRGINIGASVPSGYTEFKDSKNNLFMVAAQNSEMYEQMHNKPSVKGVLVHIQAIL